MKFQSYCTQLGIIHCMGPYYFFKFMHAPFSLRYMKTTLLQGVNKVTSQVRVSCMPRIKLYITCTLYTYPALKVKEKYRNYMYLLLLHL